MIAKSIPALPATAARFSRAAAALLLAMAACAAPHASFASQSTDSAAGAARADAEPVLVFITRHAEKGADDPKDPGLSDAGRERALALAGMVGRCGVTNLFATEWKRTAQTLEPLAQRCGLRVETVAAAASSELVTRLLALPAGSIAVVAGHSNTVPALVRGLGGSLDGTTQSERGEMLPESEFGRVMLLVLPPPRAPDRKPLRTIELSVGAR